LIVITSRPLLRSTSAIRIQASHRVVIRFTPGYGEIGHRESNRRKSGQRPGQVHGRKAMEELHRIRKMGEVV
jgi:hypothetical protein